MRRTQWLSLLSLPVLGTALGCVSLPAHGDDPSLVARYAEFHAQHRAPLTVQLQGFLRSAWRPTAYTTSAFSKTDSTEETHEKPDGTASTTTTDHTRSGSNTDTSYERYTDTVHRDLIRTQLENLRTVDRVVDESYDGEVDLVIRGEMKSDGLDTRSRIMAGLASATLLWLTGLPIYESAHGSVTLRVYDPTNRFLKEYRVRTRASRWQPWGGGAIEEFGDIGWDAAGFALKGALADLAADIDGGELAP